MMSNFIFLAVRKNISPHRNQVPWLLRNFHFANFHHSVASIINGLLLKNNNYRYYVTRPPDSPEVIMLYACSNDTPRQGLVLGSYINPLSRVPTPILTDTAARFNRMVNGKLIDMLTLSGPTPQRNEVRLLYGLEPRFPSVAVVGLGDECLSYNEAEQIDENKERIRQAVGAACIVLQKISKVETIYTESFGHAESAAEGAGMSVWVYQDHKKIENRQVIPKLFLYDDCDYTGWQIGLHKAAAQNLARQLTDAPPNLLLPKNFAEHSVKLLNQAGINIEMKIKTWLKMVGMESLLAISKGSCEDPLLIEASYYGCDPDICPIVLIGKGVTFDSGGLCLKKRKRMVNMRKDMAGGAVVVAVMRAAAHLRLPINIRGLIPMCENMLGPRALKPGDIVQSLKGPSVRYLDTDVDGRLSMIDILTYAATYKPKFILDIGTLSKGIVPAIGEAATGVWTNNDALWEQMRVASIHTGDRVWRFPLWKHFSKRVRKTVGADMKDTGTREGGPCFGAAFLEQFLCGGDWIHLDNYGVTETDGSTWTYLRKGMSGRPTRTLIEFLAQFACEPPKKTTKDKPSLLPPKKSEQKTLCKYINDSGCQPEPR